jgi:hypothetical protein
LGGGDHLQRLVALFTHEFIGALAFCDRERNLAFSYCTNFQCEGAGTGIRCRLLGEAAGGIASTWTVET